MARTIARAALSTSPSVSLPSIGISLATFSTHGAVIAGLANCFHRVVDVANRYTLVDAALVAAVGRSPLPDPPDRLVGHVLQLVELTLCDPLLERPDDLWRDHADVS